MTAGAALPFKGAGDGARVLDAFVDEIERSGQPKHIHLVGHSNGSILQGALLGALRDLARQQDCAWLHLDSGVQRKQAHKFYFREGMTVSSFHFPEKLTD